MQRSFNEMPQQATLSPSPIRALLNLATSLTRFTGSAPPDTSAPSDQRRISHPHNPPQTFQRPSEDMADRSWPPRRPRLQHQASQTLTIDLTDEIEDAPVLSRNEHRAQAQRPPHLGRSDAQVLGNIIDLTDDNDVEITSSRQLPMPRRTVLPHPVRASPLYLASYPPIPSPFARRNVNRVFGNDEDLASFNLDPDPETVVLHFERALNNINMEHFLHLNNAQVMPDRMDYERGAFADRNPEHVPPPPAKEGFTRSPTENDIVICPSCEEELVHKKDSEGQIVKKGGKTPTKKEREEHPFWVVRECGHVSHHPW